MKKIHPEIADDIIIVHPQMKNLLSHRVFPIPPRMLTDLWDYGSLAPKVEEKYIRAMLSQLKLPAANLICFVKTVLKWTSEKLKEISALSAFFFWPHQVFRRHVSDLV